VRNHDYPNPVTGTHTTTDSNRDPATTDTGRTNHQPDHYLKTNYTA
jgi:hypothetical protein